MKVSYLVDNALGDQGVLQNMLTEILIEQWTECTAGGGCGRCSVGGIAVLLALLLVRALLELFVDDLWHG